jgi:hypothetical protein
MGSKPIGVAIPIVVGKVFLIADPIVSLTSPAIIRGGHENNPFPYRVFCATPKLTHAKANRERVGKVRAGGVVTRLTNHPPRMGGFIVAGWGDLTLYNPACGMGAGDIFNKIALC